MNEPMVTYNPCSRRECKGSMLPQDLQLGERWVKIHVCHLCGRNDERAPDDTRRRRDLMPAARART